MSQMVRCADREHFQLLTITSHHRRLTTVTRQRLYLAVVQQMLRNKLNMQRNAGHGAARAANSATMAITQYATSK